MHSRCTDRYRAKSAEEEHKAPSEEGWFHHGIWWQEEECLTLQTGRESGQGHTLQRPEVRSFAMAEGHVSGKHVWIQDGERIPDRVDVMVGEFLQFLALSHSGSDLWD